MERVGKQLRTYLPGFFLTAIGIWILDRSFLGAFRHPNNYTFGGSLDALKNYFTPAFYIKYDSGVHFSGMNYPYGEHVLYTDNQPLLSWLLKGWDQLFGGVVGHEVGILNLFMLLGLVLSMYLIFRLARHYHLPVWHAFPVAIILALLSPQVHRFSGHYALAYTPVIPLIWNLLIFATKGRRTLIGTLFLLLSLFLIGLIHAYYLLMGVMFAFGYLAIRAWKYRKIYPKQAQTDLIKALLAAFLPILGMQTFLYLTDPVTDRLASPSGFMFYRAYWHGVFLPVQGPLFEAWWKFAPTQRTTVEGFSYVGLTATLVGLFSLVRALRYGWHKRFRRLIHPALPQDLSIALGAGMLLLFFSLAIPFIWGLESWVEHLGPLQQFRSLGRFAWVFYYVFTLYAAVYLYLVYRRLRLQQLRIIGLWVLGLSLAVWGFEAALHIKIHYDSIKRHKNDNVLIHEQPDYRSWLQQAGYELSDFQAIVPVPVFNTGSEKFVPERVTAAIMAQSFKLAYDTGLPLACGSMSRTSLSQSAKIVQLFSGDWIEKEILADFPNQKPLLMLVERNVPLGLEEQLMAEKGIPIADNGRFFLYQLPLDSLQSKASAAFTRFEQEKDSLSHLGRLWLSQDSAWAYFNGFDQSAGSDFGKEYLQVRGDESAMVYQGPIPDTQFYLVSVWMRIVPEVAGFPAFYFREIDADGNQVQFVEKGSMFTNTVYQDFAQVRHRFRVAKPGNRVEIYLRYRQPELESALIRPEGVDVFMPLTDSNRLMFNNFYLEQ